MRFKEEEENNEKGINFFEEYQRSQKTNSLIEIFNFRETIQEFIIDTYPIFESGIKTMTHPNVFISNQLSESLQNVLYLSEKIAKKCITTRTPTKDEIRAFRNISSIIINEILSNTNDETVNEIDFDEIASEISSGLNNIPVSSFPSHKTYTNITSGIVVIGEILKMISVYDFRKSKKDLLQNLSEIVFEEINNCIKKLVPDSAPESEVNELLHVISLYMGKMMATAYEKHTYNFINYLKNNKNTEENIQNICLNHNPIHDIQNIFESYASMFSEQIYFYAKNMVTLQKKNNNK